MYSIGEISKIVKISIDALRYYDEIGILKPHHIDKNNNYRYYSDDQIKELLFIMELKQYGFSLDAIKELMHNREDGRLLEACQTRFYQLEKEIQEIEKSLSILKKRICSLKKGKESGFEGKKVLIVDDSVFMRNVLRQILEQHGYFVAGEGSNGNEGIEKYFELNPDVVIMDIKMPGMDGIAALKKIREFDRKARVIICSAAKSLPMVLDALKNGASDYIVKPFYAENFIGTMEKITENDFGINVETIEAIQGNSAFEDKFSINPLSQENIDDLIKLCTYGYRYSEKNIIDFFDSLEV